MRHFVKNSDAENTDLANHLLANVKRLLLHVSVRLELTKDASR